MKYFLQRLKNWFWHLPKSIFANLYYGFPSEKLVLIGVTGTDGKTTTATLIHHCLQNFHLHSDLITTINSPGLHTTSPDPLVLQKLFAGMVKKNITHAVVETTAHGLDQFRFFGCHFFAGVITNIAHEHLDDFPNLNLYTQAKTILFRQSENKIFNADDPSYSSLSRLFPHHLSYSIKNKSDFQAKNIKINSKTMTFTVNHLPFTTNSNYFYQIYNILAALALCHSLSIPPSILQNTIKKFPEVVGRRQLVKNRLHLKTIVDFAHTPQALEQTLLSLKKITPGRLICLFGATGGRDQSKRPLMGKVVSQIADIAIITADDTRHEKVSDINRQIISGISPNKIYYNIPDRQEAFNQAVKLARSGDTIVACGKGHETTILYGTTEYPWSEAQAFRTAFKLKPNV